MERTTVIMGIITIIVLAVVGSLAMKIVGGFTDSNQPTAVVSVFDDAYDITNSTPITFPK